MCQQFADDFWAAAGWLWQALTEHTLFTLWGLYMVNQLFMAPHLNVVQAVWQAGRWTARRVRRFWPWW